MPDTGVPPAGDSLGPVNAVGATRFLAFGDSITQGVLSSFDGSVLFDPPAGSDYPSQLDSLLEATFTTQDFTVDNYGVGGDEIGNALANGRLNNALAVTRPQGLLLLMGINDLNSGKTVTTVVGYLQQAIDLARVYNATVLVATMFQTCVTTDPTSGRVRTNSYDRIVSFNNALRAMAAGRQNVHVVDIYAAFGHNCGDDRGINLLGGDGLHPSSSGYSVMASVFGQAIRDRFAVRGSFQ